MTIQIDKEVRKVCQGIRLGILQADVVVTPSSEELLEEIATECRGWLQKNSPQSVRQLPMVKSTREAYKKLGKDPSRYRPSAEALLRRAVQGKGLYQVNNVVDLLNLVSLKTGFSIGGYDTSKIELLTNKIDLRKGSGEAYNAIGRGELNITDLPVLYDSIGPFGSPTSDSQRTMITDQTKMITMVFFDFDGEGPLSAAGESAKQLLVRYSGSIDCNFIISS